MKALGQHLILELYGCSAASLSSVADFRVSRVLRRLWDAARPHRPEVVVRLLRALVKAEDFIRKNHGETVAIIQASHGRKVSPTEIKELLVDYRYQLTLEHGMLMGLEDMARWTGQQGGENQRVIPNFLRLIAAEPLRAVKPEAVRLEK